MFLQLCPPAIAKCNALQRFPCNPLGDECYNDINRIYAYDRGGIIVIINNSDKESYIELPAWSGVYDDVITGEKKTAYNQVLRLTIGPQTYHILKREF